MKIFKNARYSCDFKAEFLASLLQSHDPSEIILIFWFAAQKTFYYYVENSRVEFFQVSLMNRKFRRTAFIWNRNLCNIVFIITFDQFKASLLNKSINFYNPRSWTLLYQIKTKCHQNYSEDSRFPSEIHSYKSPAPHFDFETCSGHVYSAKSNATNKSMYGKCW